MHRYVRNDECGAAIAIGIFINVHVSSFFIDVLCAGAYGFKKMRRHSNISIEQSRAVRARASIERSSDLKDERWQREGGGFIKIQ